MEKKQIWVYPYSVQFGCGLQTCGDFTYNTQDRYSPRIKIEEYDPTHTGYFVASYIESDICKEVKEYFDKKFDVVFKSETRKNLNSGNQFHFVIYSVKGVSNAKT